MIISIHLIIQTNKASAWNLVQTSHRHASYFGYWNPRPHILSKSELNIHSSFTRRLSLSGKLAINHLAPNVGLFKEVPGRLYAKPVFTKSVICQVIYVHDPCSSAISCSTLKSCHPVPVVCNRLLSLNYSQPALFGSRNLVQLRSIVTFKRNLYDGG